MLAFVAIGANPGNYVLAASQFLRALRGRRSQRALAKRLGYRANPITDWEHGRRFPRADEALRAAHLTGVDVRGAFAGFHRAPLNEPNPGVYELPAWLTALVGSTTTVDLARRAGSSRFALRRWLTGQARPRLPDFFRVVDAATGRLPDLVAQLVAIDEVPALLERHRASEAARLAAYDAPWTEAVLRVLESTDYRRLSKHEPGWIAQRLGIAIEHEQRSLALLRQLRVVRRSRGLYRPVQDSSVDTRGDAERVNALLEHWSGVGRQRIATRRQHDLFAYNVCSLSHADYERVVTLLRSTFREIRSVLSSSAPAERVALLNLQWIDLA
jgi:transcriptional regulator with XRE-family HTH domain